MRKILKLEGRLPEPVDRESDGERFWYGGLVAKGNAFYTDFEIGHTVTDYKITSGDGGIRIQGTTVRLWRYTEDTLRARIEYEIPDKS